MRTRVVRVAGCVFLAAAMCLTLAQPLFADDDDDDNDDDSRGRSRGRGMAQLVWLIVKLTGEENWGDVRVIGPVDDDDRSDSEDDF